MKDYVILKKESDHVDHLFLCNNETKEPIAEVSSEAKTWIVEGNEYDKSQVKFAILNNHNNSREFLGDHYSLHPIALKNLSLIACIKCPTCHIYH